jgi:DNA-binding transcriptional regulator/RsmH inhibitor MraZ
MTWEVSIDGDGRLILPETPRKLGLAPSAPDVGVVFAYGEILEIWKLEAWDRFFGEHGLNLQEWVDALSMP